MKLTEVFEYLKDGGMIKSISLNLEIQVEHLPRIKAPNKTEYIPVFWNFVNDNIFAFTPETLFSEDWEIGK